LYFEGPVNDEESDDETEPINDFIVTAPYIPEVRPISFNFAFDQRSPLTPISNEDLLADIDAAIDDSFNYSSMDTSYDALPTPNALRAASHHETLPTTTYTLLPATTYSPSTDVSYDTPSSTSYDTLPSTSYDTLPSTTYKASAPPTLDTLPSTTYIRDSILPSATYVPSHGRKDSVMPYSASSDVPPVPPKDEKYRRGSEATAMI
jgi:hypothetical protein